VDQQDFESLYREHAKGVRAYVGRRIDPSDVDDVVGDVWLTAWRRRDELPGRPLPWLLGTARKTLANHRRRHSRLRAFVERVSGTTALYVEDVQVSDGVLAQALGRLSSKDREALLLTAWDGLKTDEAASVMQCSPSAFNTRVHRARKRLRRELDALEDLAAPVRLATTEVTP
jgi:RNA polymerase sigma-70 factor (ECF subfamily)